jgi:hypothetical protein
LALSNHSLTLTIVSVIEYKNVKFSFVAVYLCLNPQSTSLKANTPFIGRKRANGTILNTSAKKNNQNDK